MTGRDVNGDFFAVTLEDITGITPCRQGSSIQLPNGAWVVVGKADGATVGKAWQEWRAEREA